MRLLNPHSPINYVAPKQRARIPGNRDWGTPEMEWRLLDAMAAHDDVIRFVEATRRGDVPIYGAGPEAPRPRTKERSLGQHWDMEKINANWAALWDGVAPPAGSSPRSSPPRSSTAPTAQPVARLLTASEPEGSSTRRKPVTTSTNIDWKHDKTTPPRSNEAIAAIMRELAVTRRRAYIILRERQAASIDIEGIGNGLRVAVLGAVITHPELGGDGANYLDVLHDNGVRINEHDIVKTMWALQKQGQLSFRARHDPHRLYAIKATLKGLTDYDEMTRKPTDEEKVASSLLTEAAQRKSDALTQEPMPETAEEMAEVAEPWVPPSRRDDLAQAAPVVEAAEHAIASALEVANRARKAQAAIDAITKEATHEVKMMSAPIADWENYPLIEGILERARRAIKIEEATKILEEVGETELVLALMVKYEFSPLETEVRHLLEAWGVV